MIWKILTAAGLAAVTVAPAVAQTAPASPAAPQAGTVDSSAAVRNNRDQVEGYNRVVNEGVKVTNADDNRAKRKRAGPVLATTDDFVAGAAVRDKFGVQIATIHQLEADGVIVNSDDRLAKLPTSSFGKDDGGLLIGIAADEFRAAIAATSVPLVQEPRIVDATAADMTLGAAVRDSEGVQFGTVDKMADDGVIVVVDGRKIKMALNSFAKDADGLLIGITASELRAAINK